MIDIIAPNQTGTIRQLTNEDFDAMYQIWEDGICAKGNSGLANLLGFISEANPHVQRLIHEVGFQRIAPLPRSQKDDVLGGTSGGELGSRLIVYCLAL